MPTDPVCGMFVEARDDGLRLVRENRSYFFCSASCLSAFAEPERARRRLARRLLVAWPLSVVILLLTYTASGELAAVLAGILAAVVQVYPGGPFYRGAYDAIRHRVGNMDLLIAVATTAAFGYSLAVVAGVSALPRATYFDASALIVTLILTGNYLEQLTRTRAGSAVRRLREILPRTASRLMGDSEAEVSIEAVVPGDLLRVRPGVRFPVDGAVRVGTTSADESLLTGEPGPVFKGPGSSVLAGSTNLEAAVVVETRRIGADTFVAEVGALLTSAELSRVPLQRTADRLAAAFVPFVLLLAVVAAVAWYLFGGAGPTTATLVFVTVAITACPCAFGIATPAAIIVGTGRAAEEGVLYRGEDAIERAARVDTVLTDKTGTLTSGTVELVGVTPVPPAREPEVLALAAGVEAASDHVLARAVRHAAAGRGVAAAAVSELRLDPGQGVRGVVDGRAVALVRGAAARQLGVDLSSVEDAVRAAEAAGDTWSVLTLQSEPVGLLRFRARVMAGSGAAVRALEAAGIRVVMVTGDSEAAALAVARELGVADVHAGVLPAGKVDLVRKYQFEGHRVAFVGDGINDAAAIAAADVGIAIGTGSEVAREVGRVLLVRPEFAEVPFALSTARRTVRRVRANLAWAIGYNAVLLPIAAGALVPWLGLGIYSILPILGAVAMAISSTTVVASSLSLRWPRPAHPARVASPSGVASGASATP